MKLKLFSIHDSKAAAFITPFFSPTTATALRSFATAANDMQTDFYKYGGDYTLFELGTFDQETARLETHQAPVNLGLAISFVENTETRWKKAGEEWSDDELPMPTAIKKEN